MKVNKNIEKPSYIMGLPMQEFILVVVYCSVLFIINNLLASFDIILGKWFWLFILFSTWGLYLILKWGTKQNYPGFLLSFFSYKFLQRRKIELRKFQINIIS